MNINSHYQTLECIVLPTRTCTKHTQRAAYWGVSRSFSCKVVQAADRRPAEMANWGMQPGLQGLTGLYGTLVLCVRFAGAGGKSILSETITPMITKPDAPERSPG